MQYQIDNSKLAVMLECIKEDERRNRLFDEAGYGTSGGYVTDRLESIVFDLIGFKGSLNHTFPDGEEYEENEIAGRLLLSNYYHGKKWKNSMDSIDQLYVLKEKLEKRDYSNIEMESAKGIRGKL